jgi:hypothetical protein
MPCKKDPTTLVGSLSPILQNDHTSSNYGMLLFDCRGVSSGMLWLGPVLIVLLLPALAVGQGPLRRCYQCRSRGEQGDCRDPFLPPAAAEPGLPAPAHKTAIFETPCSSGCECFTILVAVTIFILHKYRTVP